MDSDQRRRRKRRPFFSHILTQFFSPRSLFLCFSFFLFLFLFSSDRFSSVAPSSFRPSLTSSTLSLFYSSASYSILDPLTTPLSSSLPFTLQHRILFPDHVLLMLTTRRQIHHHQLECVYYSDILNFSGSTASAEPEVDPIVAPVLSVDQYDEFRSIARCPLPRTNFSGVELRWRGEVGRRSLDSLVNQTGLYWDKVVYEASLDGETAVVYVKGLNLRPHKISDPTQFRCHFGVKDLQQDGAFLLTTEAVSVAQEVVRCLLPQSIRNNPDKAQGMRVTVSHLGGNLRHPVRELMPSVARVHSPSRRVQRSNKGKHELCVCTMVWNQASALREWIMYHAWLGVERWFIYDNNSDDDIQKVIHDLDRQGYNVSRRIWPWIKTQEAGFSHCALRAREECRWVGFFDVDEFFYFSNEFHHQLGGQGLPGEKSLRSVVAKFSSSRSIAEIRTACHSFGPSGLNSPPKQGVTVGYTCRLQRPERHKSIVRPDLLDISLLNVVHHFELREGFRFRNMPEGTAVINHYKYQVWETFKTKFFRRVATYVVDWQEDQNKGSKDRAPGLGTEAVEPPNWRLKFCEVWDTGLKDFLLSYFVDPATGLMPWEMSFL